MYQCLAKFAENEKLNDTETLYCSGCKQVLLFVLIALPLPTISELLNFNTHTHTQIYTLFSLSYQHLAPEKKMDIWRAPEILIIHLKRFQYIPGQYFVHREKISDVIDFPVEGLGHI